MVARKRGAPAHLSNPGMERNVALTPQDQMLKQALSHFEGSPAYKDATASGAAFTAAIDDMIERNGLQVVAEARRQVSAPLVRILQHHVKKRDFRKAKEMFAGIRNSQLPSDGAIFTPLIDGLLRAQRTDEALELFREMRAAPDLEQVASPYNAFLTHYLARRKYELFYDTYSDLLKAKVKPTIVTFGLLVQAAVNTRDDRRAWSTIENDMPIADVVPDTHIFSIALGVTARNHGYDAAVAKLDAIPEAHLDLVEPYDHILEGLTNFNDVEGALAIYERLLRHTDPTTTTFVYLLKICMGRGEPARAYELLEDVVKYGVELDSHLLSAIATVLCANGDPADAEELLRDRIGEMYVSLQPLVDHYSKLGDVEQAERVLAEFQPDIMPTRDSLLPLLGAYCTHPQQRNRELAEKTYAAIVRDQYSYETVTEHTYMMQMYTALRERTLAFKFYESGLAVPKHNHAFPPHFVAALICFHDDRLRKQVVERELRTRLGPHKTKEATKLANDALKRKK